MNDITVLDVLSLPIMRNARLKAGHSGLNRSIQYVNILDNRFDDTATSEHLPKYGDNFYITSMYHGTRDADYIMKVLRHFIEVQASAVCIIDEYLEELPEEAYALCNETGLPVMFVDKDTPYPIIISSIMELKLSYQKARQTEFLISSLCSPDCTEAQTEETLKKLSTKFLRNVFAVHLLFSTEPQNSNIANQLKLISLFSEQPGCFAAEYRNGILIIQSCEDSSESHVDGLLKKIMEAAFRFLNDAQAGVSRLHYLLEVGAAINEACTAAKSAAAGTTGIIHFQNLGPEKLLLALSGRPVLNSYFQEIYQPLKDYDEKYNSRLLETIYTFVEHNMDYIKTSKAMFIHENTVRYRLSKVKSLIPYGICDMDFEQTLYLFCKISKLQPL